MVEPGNCRGESRFEQDAELACGFRPLFHRHADTEFVGTGTNSAISISWEHAHKSTNRQSLAIIPTLPPTDECWDWAGRATCNLQPAPCTLRPSHVAMRSVTNMMVG